MHKITLNASPLHTQKIPTPVPGLCGISVFCEKNANIDISYPHSHSFFELLFIEDSEGWCCIGDRQLWAKPGDLFAIAPGEIHDASGLDGATKWIITFQADALAPIRTDSNVFLMPSQELLLSFLHADKVELRHLCIPQEQRPRWLMQLEQLESELKDQSLGFTEAARALLVLLFVDIARLAAPQLKKCCFPPHPVLAKVFHFIEANYHQPIGLQEVAKEVGFSPAYLTNLIRRETGRSLHKWIVERRMAQARCLLLETDQSVSQIASALGYFDPGHFIRLFRRVNGTTPQKWRLMQSKLV